jgi:DNA-binding transcriptional LysR family regulator
MIVIPTPSFAASSCALVRSTSEKSTDVTRNSSRAGYTALRSSPSHKDNASLTDVGEQFYRRCKGMLPDIKDAEAPFNASAL